MVENEDSGSHLRAYERHVACLLSGLLVGLGLFAAIEGRNKTVGMGEAIHVRVVGAVRETEAELPLGATLDEVLTRVELAAEADTEELDGLRRLMNGEIVVIPYVGKTTLYVTGAVVEPKVVILQKNATPRQVLECVQLQTNANVAQFMRRRSFRTGSVIEIKKKKESVEKKQN